MGKIFISVTASQNLFEIRWLQICHNWRTRINLSAGSSLILIVIKVHRVGFGIYCEEKKSQIVGNLAGTPNQSSLLLQASSFQFLSTYLHNILLKFMDLKINRNKCDVQPCFILTINIHRHRDYWVKTQIAPTFSLIREKQIIKMLFNLGVKICNARPHIRKTMLCVS